MNENARLAIEAHPGPPWWYVAFAPGENAWWHRFLKRGFGHVYAFGYDPRADVWLRADTLFTHADIRVMSKIEVAAEFEMHARRMTRLLRVIPDTAPRAPKLHLLASCVSLTAHLVGLRARAVTPFGLWRRLIAAGRARPVKRRQG